jgi:hypothetical protein
MDIKDLQMQAKLAHDLSVTKKNIKERLSNRLMLSHNGGVFRVSTDLFVLLTIFEDHELVLLDAYDVPVCVNRQELMSLAKQRYAEVMNEWLNDWLLLKKTRKGEDV